MTKKIIDGKEVEVTCLCPYYRYTDVNGYTRFDYCVEESCGKWDAVNKQCCELTYAQALSQIAQVMCK